MSQAPLKMIQISDMHLMADRDGALLGVKTLESFQAVLDLAQKEEKELDLILLSGDLSQDGSELAYQRIATMMRNFHVPVYYVPGNHDDVKIQNHIFPLETISNHKHIILKNWHLILLNSQVVGAVEGFLNPSQLEYLEHCLQAYPEHEAIIVFHHQPVSVGCRWLDNSGLKNADEFWHVLSRYPKVNTVLFGHVHQEVKEEKNGIKCFALPSTCIQFKPKQDKFGLDNIPPGYRWIYLYEDGKIETGIKRVANYVGVFDRDAKGY